MDSFLFARPAPNINGPIPGESADSDRLDLLWAQLALIGITVSLCNAIVYYPLRLGLASPPLLVPTCVLIVAATLLAPLLLPRRGLFANPNVRSATMPLLSLAVMASVVIALFLHAFLLMLYVAVILAGARRALQLLRTQSSLQLFFCISVGCVIGLYLFGTVQSLNLAGVYSPEQSLIGTLNHDTIFHSAIAFLIQNFGVPSLGVDGIIPIRYHFGSHLWLAALGRMTLSDPVFSYGAGVPIVLAPTLIAALFLSAVSIDRGRKSLPAYLLVGVVLVLLSDAIGWKSYYISESYTCGLIGLLLLLPLFALVAGDAPLPPRQLSIALAMAVLVIPLLLVLKVSVGSLWTGALGYTVLRRYGFSNRVMLTCFAAGAIFLVVVHILSPSPKDYKALSGSLIVPFFFFRLFGPVSLSSFAIPLVLLLSKTRLYGGEGLRATFSAKSDLMFEVTMVVMVLGAIPPTIGLPQDSAVWYFLNVSQWIAMALLITRFAPASFPWQARDVILRAVPIIVVSAGLALLLLPGVYKQASSVLLDANSKSGGRLLHGRTPSRYFYQTLVNEHVLWGSEFRDTVTATAGAQLIQIVRHAIPRPDRNTAIFIPPQNKAFWSRSPTCMEKFNSQVSLTGQPSLLGEPPECDTDAYTSDYGARFQSRSTSDRELCEHAKQRNIQRVLVVAESRPSERNQIIDCGSAAPR